MQFCQVNIFLAEKLTNRVLVTPNFDLYPTHFIVTPYVILCDNKTCYKEVPLCIHLFFIPEFPGTQGDDDLS